MEKKLNCCVGPPLGLEFNFSLGDLVKFITKLQNYKIEQTQVLKKN